MKDEIKTSGENELLTPRQAAKLLKISYDSILNYIKQGLIRADSINPTSARPHYRIRARELDKLLVRVKSEQERRLEDTSPEQPLEPETPGVKII